ncbi:hypothetical protein ACFL9T_19130 [Thermodesulfobacteriota bacterium]
MTDKEKIGKKPDPVRLNILKNLPSEIMKSLSKEETHAILHEDVWPDSLSEKLKDYMVEED